MLYSVECNFIAACMVCSICYEGCDETAGAINKLYKYIKSRHCNKAVG